MSKMILKITAVLIGLSFILAGLSQASATVVWSDDFEDGNYDGWTVEDGAFSVTGGALRTEPTVDLNSVIWHPSTTTVGTWNFSFMYDDTETADSHYFVMFMSVDQNIALDQQAGYGIEIIDEYESDPRIRLVKQNGTWFTVTALLLPHYIENLRHTWSDFAVSRNSTGGFNVWINRTHTFEVVHTEHDTSEMFVYNSWKPDHGAAGGHLDNIVVDDVPISPYVPETTPEPTTPSETPTGPGSPEPIDPMILAIAGAGVVIVVLAVVCMKRR